MPIYRSPGDAIKGEKIICEFEDRPSFRDKGNHIESTIQGNLAKAVLVKTWKIKQV